MQIGVVCKDLFNSQLNYDIIKALNSVADIHSVCVMYRDISLNFRPIAFPVFNYVKAHNTYFDTSSILLATDIESSICIKNIVNAARKVFYVYELEFLRNRNFDRNYEALTGIELITRSESYAKCIQNYCGVLPKVLPLDIERIIQVK